MIKKRGIILSMLMILILGIFLASSSSEKSKTNKISEEVYNVLEKSNEVRVVIRLKEPTEEKGFLIKTQKTESKIISEKQNVKEDIIETVGKENVKHVFDDYMAIEVSENDLDKLEYNSDIESVIIDKPIHAFLQQSIPLINASRVWSIQLSGINITGTGETVCIIDTGINFTHPDLIGKNKTCIIDCITNVNCIENCSIGDDNGHGTHVAGIAAASGGINGVAINISLIGVKALDSNGDGYSSDVEAGIDWCVSNSSVYNISIISMSLGDCSNHSTYCNSNSMAPSINSAVGRNISVIVAAGNGPGGTCSGITNTNGTAAPACVQNATAVGAVNKNDVINYQRGALFELIAPGISINSTNGKCLSDCTCSGNYMVCSGTSMATPHVAGAFALIRQFFRLQNNRVPTPDEIKAILNNTGKRIDDSAESGYNFSRIDIWSALISLDISNPIVNLTFPLNNTIQFTQNVTFRCSANDVLLSNITLYVWNSSGVYNNTEVKQVSGTNANVEFNLTNITYGSYKWNCLAYDSKGNFSFAGSNYTITIGQIAVTLNSPTDNLFTNQNQTYNCSAETELTKRLTNLTFYLWNSTNNLIFNSTNNISGTSNSTTLSYNFTLEGNYSWNCLAYNNLSESAWADANYTITYDVTKPNITLISPENSATYTSNSQSITFSYNVSGNNLANCSLIINNAISLTNSSIINLSQTQNFTQTFTPETYTWNINCTDNANNRANSSQRSFTVSAPVSPVIQQSGGGGGSPVKPVVYEPTIEEVSSPTGYTQTLSKNDKIKFTFFDERSENHTLTVNEIGSNYVNLTIQSNPISLKLGVEQSAKLNLTNENYYNFYIKLNSIENNKAGITIQTIHEEIPKAKITGEVVEEKKPEIEEKEIEPESRIGEKIKNILIVILIASVLVLLAERMRKEKGRKIKTK